MISQIFIERPRLAMVVSIIITLAGLIALYNIPVSQYPPITPPEIRETAAYPGANARVVADNVAAPIEKEVNGVEKMLYMSSTCANDGRYELAVTFAVGSNPDIDQVNLQNRVQLATAKLPKEVIEQGISVRKRSTDILGVVAFYSPGGTRDKLFMSNYVDSNIKNALVRIDGVSASSRSPLMIRAPSIMRSGYGLSRPVVVTVASVPAVTAPVTGLLLPPVVRGNVTVAPNSSSSSRAVAAMSS